jgi:hypothetical protein
MRPNPTTAVPDDGTSTRLIVGLLVVVSLVAAVGIGFVMGQSAGVRMLNVPPAKVKPLPGFKSPKLIPGGRDGGR